MALRRAIAILESASGSEHLDMARAAYTLGLVEHDAGNLEESRVQFERALGSYRNVHGPAHRTVANALYGLACLSAVEGDREAALDELREAIESGLTGVDLLNDSDFDALHGDPKFEALVEELRADSPAEE